MQLKRLLKQDFVRDRAVTALVIATVVLVVVEVLLVALRLHRQDFEIPIRYTQVGSSPITLGEWYLLYGLPLFAVVAGAINITLALRVHKTARWLSLLGLTFGIIVLIFLLFVSHGLLGLAPRG